jgi:SAM-dependent methyltransferase
VPYAEFRPEFTDVMDGLGRGVLDELLVDAYLPLAPGLAERLAAGARVADIGRGTGHAMVLLASAFPASTFVGYDLAEDTIARARSEAAGLGAAWGEQAARAMLAEAGFGEVVTREAPGDPTNAVFVTTRPRT